MCLDLVDTYVYIEDYETNLYKTRLGCMTNGSTGQRLVAN